MDSHMDAEWTAICMDGCELSSVRIVLAMLAVPLIADYGEHNANSVRRVLQRFRAAGL